MLGLCKYWIKEKNNNNKNDDKNSNIKIQAKKKWEENLAFIKCNDSEKKSKTKNEALHFSPPFLAISPLPINIQPPKYKIFP